MVDPLNYSTTTVTKAVICIILSDTLLLIGKSKPCGGGNGFPLSISGYPVQCSPRHTPILAVCLAQ